MASLRNPENLCERLGLRPAVEQRELMHRFFEDENPLEVKEVPAERTCNAVAVCALWRALCVPGSRTIVIAANRDLESRFMGFLYEITTRIDPALTSACRWTNGKTLQFGTEAGYELRFMSNKPGFLQGVHGDAVLWVVLGARSSEPHFCETMKVIDGYRGVEGHRHIIVW